MYRRASNHSNRILLAALAAVLPVAYACGAGDSGQEATADATPVCSVPSDSIIGYALERFIRTRNPSPHRFLLPLGTDSVVPDGAQYVMTLFGRASYVWPGDPALQREQINNMRARGSWVTVVLYYHGIDSLPENRFNVAFSGRYVDRTNDGINLARTNVMFDCFAPPNRRVLTEDEPPPPPDDTASTATPATPAASKGGN